MGEQGDPRDMTVVTGLLCVAGAAAAAVVVGTTGTDVGSIPLLAALAATFAFTGVVPFTLIRREQGAEVHADEAVLVLMFLLLPATGTVVAAVAGILVVHLVRRRALLKAVYNHGTQALATSLAALLYLALADDPVGTSSQANVVAAMAAAILHTTLVTGLVWAAVARALRQPIREVARDSLGVHVLLALGAVGWGAFAVVGAANDALALAIVVVPVALSWSAFRLERQRATMAVLLDAAVASAAAVRDGTVEQIAAEATDDALARSGSRIVSEPPPAGALASRLPIDGAPRWLVAGPALHRQSDGAAAQQLLDGLSAITATALGNSELLEAAGRDPLTGLLTGPLLLDRIEPTGAVGERWVLVFKIGRLDVVREALGPRGADEAFARLGERMVDVATGITADCDPIVGHLGSGEFALVVAGDGGEAGALGFAEDVRRSVGRAITVDGIEVAVDVVVGVAVVSLDGDGRVDRPVTAALGRATATAVRIARVGGPRVQLCSEAVEGTDLTPLELEAQLRTALHRGQIQVHYQPVLHARSGRVVGAEALARWEHPDRGWVPPQEFVLAAENSDLVVDLDRYVLARVVEQLSAWDRGGCDPSFSIAVNLSARHLSEPDTGTVVRDLLDGAGFAAHRLTLEVTESAVMLDADRAVRTLQELHAVGVRVAIDDFGTGYSSLELLRDFPLDTLKIDRSFVDQMTTSSGDAAIVAVIVRLAHTLGLQVVAEGAETAEQIAALRTFGCDLAQGWFWSPAVPAAQFEAEWLPARGREVVSVERVPSADLDDATDDVLAYLVHELRTPLAAIDGFAHMAEVEAAELDGAAAVLESLRYVRKSAAGLADLLASAEDVASIHVGGLSLTPEPVEVHGFVTEVLATAGAITGDHEVRVAREAGVVVEADVVRLGQVIRNLVSNAAKFSPPGAPIEVTVGATNDAATVTVRDHGPGVPEERRSELFRRFARLGTTTEGMGLGLHLARAIARAHGGDVTYEPAPGGGAGFTVALPLPAPGAAISASNEIAESGEGRSAW